MAEAWHQALNSRGYHRVREGETLYAIAWRYDLDYRQLAKINGLRAPYALKIGQKLRVSAKKAKKSRKTVKKSHIRGNYSRKYASNKARVRAVKPRVTRWQWPTRGRILRNYAPAQRSKGIDIAGRRNQVIRATAKGRVAYSGHGLPGYGNLIIIKHNSNYLSAYGHNERNLVKEGQYVKAGQAIARMGSSGTNRVKLHFEIRKAGKPVDPKRYLK